MTHPPKAMVPRDNWDDLQIGRTPRDVLEANRWSRRLSEPNSLPTRKQVRYLLAACKRIGITAQQLVYVSEYFERVLPFRPGEPMVLRMAGGSDFEAFMNAYSRREMGGFFEVVHAMEAAVAQGWEPPSAAQSSTM